MSKAQYIFEYKDFPLIPIKFYSKKRETPIIDALLDSGGDFIVVPYAIAKYLELKLLKAGHVDTAGGETTLSKSFVDMVINDKEHNYITNHHPSRNRRRQTQDAFSAHVVKANDLLEAEFPGHENPWHQVREQRVNRDNQNN